MGIIFIMKMKHLFHYFTIQVFLLCTANQVVLATEQPVSKYEAFARAYGIMRYYSPNPYTEKWDDIDWFKVCYYFADMIHNDMLDETEIITDMASVLAPEASLSEDASTNYRSIEAVDEPYYYRQHTGGGKIVDIPKLLLIAHPEFKDYNPFYHKLSQYVETGDYLPSPDSLYSYKLADGLYLHIPHTEKMSVFSEHNTKELLNKAEKAWHTALKKCGQSRQRVINMIHNNAFRITDIIIRWNIIRHFYPYFEEDVPNWDELLPQMIADMENMEFGESGRHDVYLFKEKIESLLSPVNDSHLKVLPNIILGKALNFHISYHYLPLSLDVVEENIVVRNVANSIKGSILPGCRITHINGIPAVDLLRSVASKISSGNPIAAKRIATQRIMSSYKADTVFVVGYKDINGMEHIDSLRPTAPDPMYDEEHQPFISFTDGIAIIRPCVQSASYANFFEHIEALRNAKGVIFDFRGYPTWEFDKILAHFIYEPKSYNCFYTPITRFPFRQRVEYIAEDGILEPAEPYLSVPTVYLINDITMSWGETIMMIVKGCGIGTVIGTPSCGTNGDVTLYRSPMFWFNLTGLRAVNADGSRHHGVGVVPDIEVTETFEGYRAGRDEILEAGLDYIRKVSE